VPGGHVAEGNFGGQVNIGVKTTLTKALYYERTVVQAAQKWT